MANPERSATVQNIKSFRFAEEDQFGRTGNKILDALPESEKTFWNALLNADQKVSGSKPSKKFMDQNTAVIRQLGAERFLSTTKECLSFLRSMKADEDHYTYTDNSGTTFNYTSYGFLWDVNADPLKGLIWLCSDFNDPETLSLLADVAENCFRKIPGKGAAAPSVGNACLYSLYKASGREGIGHLSRLKLRIRQTSTQSLIEKYLQETATDEGVSVSEIEDLAVDDLGLIDGKRVFELSEYTAVIQIESLHHVSVVWHNPDQTTQKAAPSILKQDHADTVKLIKKVVNDIGLSLQTQRDRLDRMYRADRKMTWEYFHKHYVTHGLLSYLSKSLIWKFTNDTKTYFCIQQKNRWITLDWEKVVPDNSFEVSLWHPTMSGVDEVRLWRDFFLSKEITQPLKQAFREIYLLTEAELHTKIYSNRMAAHILKQHQFNSLAKLRGWKYALLGSYDDGRSSEVAQLNFPQLDMRAEFRVNEVNAPNAFNETGIWDYVSTDQVRFVNNQTNHAIELKDIPPLLFSEVMRDIDLFVGVASVGNDPSWQDSGGFARHRDYWQSYSFGELSNIAKTRKDILSSLLPRLKIANVASIQDRFLVIRGKKRTYKIHLGSTNILMEPNDQYLCIVPMRSKKEKDTAIFLPFEGDAGLSSILSKAFMLAADDQITDKTILSQIG